MGPQKSLVTTRKNRAAKQAFFFLAIWIQILKECKVTVSEEEQWGWEGGEMVVLTNYTQLFAQIV